MTAVPGYAGFAFLLWPPLWVGDAPGQITRADLMQRRWVRALGVGVQIAVTREGVILFDFRGWEPTAKPAEDTDDDADLDVDELLAVDERRIATANAFLACLHTELMIHPKQ